MKLIRARLSLSFLIAALATALVVGVVTYRQTLVENEELFDYQLRQIALSLRDQGLALPRALLPDEEGQDVVVQIWTSDGVMLYLSRPGDPLFDRATIGYSDAQADGRQWRLFAMATDDRVVQVAQPRQLRRNLAAAAALRSLAPLLLFVPLMALLIWWSVSSALAPLRRLASEVGQRDARSLDEVTETGLPSEVAPLAHALNALLARLQRTFASQRAFVADAAHELRSPLAALKLQLQLLARAPDTRARDDALTQLNQGVDRATHLLAQLLTAARTDPHERLPTLTVVDLVEPVRQAIADGFGLAQARRLAIDFDAPQRLEILGDAAGLVVLARNLIDNALRYTPEDGKVRVSVIEDADAAQLVVEDSGPGIAEPERSRVFDRFYRGVETREQGSGLGLAIVKNIVAQHDAQIALDTSALGGLKVSLRFRRVGPQAT